MKKNKIWFVNEIDFNFEEIRNEMQECYAGEISDSFVWNCIHEQAQEDYEEFTKFLEQTFGYKHWVLRCEGFSRYYGSRVGYMETDNICKKMSGFGDEFDIYEENGHLYIHGIDHDWSRIIECKIMTEKGIELYDNWNFSRSNRDKNEWQILDQIFNNNLWSKLPKVGRLY